MLFSLHKSSGGKLPVATAAPTIGTGACAVAFLGTGYISDWHAKALKAVPQAKLIAVCDKSRARAEAFASAWGIARIYSSLEDMLAAEKLDAVHVLTPPEHHFAAGRTILEAGVNVLMEKPMCANAAQCAELVSIAHIANKRLSVSHNFLFSPSYERLKADLASGIIGRVDHLAINWHKELPQVRFGPFDMWMLRQPGNIMHEIGPHSVSQLLDLLGEPDALQAQAGNAIDLPGGGRFYRRWHVHGQHGPAAFELNFSFVAGFAEHTIHVRGSLGSATVDFERNTYVLNRHTAQSDDFDRHAMVLAEAKTIRHQARSTLLRYIFSKAKLCKIGSPYGASIGGSLKSFYDRLLNPALPDDPRCSGERGARSITLCERIAELAGVNGAKQSSGPQTSEPLRPIDPKILILGATGFIGSELVRQFTKAGHSVRVLVRSRGRLPADWDFSRVEVMQGDIAQPADLDRAFTGITHVYHLARANVKTWEDYQRHEIGATRLVAEKCHQHGIQRLLYTGTIDSYYAGPGAGVIDERTPLDPGIARRNLYARAKAESEQLLIRMRAEKALPVVTFRPGIVVGRGGTPFHWGVGMWPKNSICQIWGDGDVALPLVLVEDVAAALVSALNAPGIEGESFNLIGDCNLTAWQYLHELEKHAGIQLQKHRTPILKFYGVDMFKWMIKCAVRHPGRRRPSYRDWASRMQAARFDSQKAKKQLRWSPVEDRAEFIRRGIQIPLDETLA